jgi:prepilin-type N-terminal cleavage/methylation domain-containing protein
MPNATAECAIDELRITMLHDVTIQRFNDSRRQSNSSFRSAGAAAFTLLELLIVMTIIAVLAGITFATMGYVQGKARRSRAEAEIAAISAALENYKADNGDYPSTANTVSLTARATVDNNSKNGTYATATLDLYEKLTGDTAHDGTVPAGSKSYMQFKPTMLGPQGRTAPPTASNRVTSIMDPFGNSYGYSTSKNPTANPNAASASGYNPTFDLWSVGTANPTSDEKQWIKNW